MDMIRKNLFFTFLFSLGIKKRSDFLTVRVCFLSNFSWHLLSLLWEEYNADYTANLFFGMFKAKEIQDSYQIIERGINFIPFG